MAKRWLNLADVLGSNEDEEAAAHEARYGRQAPTRGRRKAPTRPQEAQDGDGPATGGDPAP